MDTTVKARAAIPLETARALCAAIQAKNRLQWYTPGGLMCLICLRSSRGDEAWMCYANRPDNRGCYQVNARYDEVE